MDLNSVPPRETYTVSRDQQPRTTQSTSARGEVDASMRSEPSTAPEGDGVLATFETTRSDDPEQGETSTNKEREADVMAEQSDRDYFASLLLSRSPADTTLDIAVDPDTQDSIFLIRNRDTGELLREIPERDITDVLREGAAAKGRFVDETF